MRGDEPRVPVDGGGEGARRALAVAPPLEDPAPEEVGLGQGRVCAQDALQLVERLGVVPALG